MQSFNKSSHSTSVRSGGPGGVGSDGFIVRGQVYDGVTTHSFRIRD